MEWRLRARDGAEVAGEPPVPAMTMVAPATIADYELPPLEPGELTLRLVQRGFGGRLLATLVVPITVAAPPMLGARQAGAGNHP